MRVHAASGPGSTSLERQLTLREDPPYPETIRSRTTVTIMLTTGRSWIGYSFEAAHEVVHALDANASTCLGTNLEEGICSAFSLHVVEEVFGRRLAMRSPLDPGDRQTYRLVSRLDEDVLSVGQRLRERVGSLAVVSPSYISSLYPQASESLTSRLLRTFKHPGR